MVGFRAKLEVLQCSHPAALSGNLQERAAGACRAGCCLPASAAAAQSDTSELGEHQDEEGLV